MAKGSYNYIPGPRVKKYRVGDAFSIDVGSGDDKVSYSEADLESMSNSEIKKILPQIKGGGVYIPRDVDRYMDIAAEYDNPEDRIRAVVEALNELDGSFNKDDNDGEAVRTQHVAFFNADGFPMHIGLGKGSTVGIPIDNADSAPSPYMAITNSRYMEPDRDVIGGLPDMSVLMAPAFGVKKIYTVTNSRAEDSGDLWVIDAEDVSFPSAQASRTFANTIIQKTSRKYEVEDPSNPNKKIKISGVERSEFQIMIDEKDQWIEDEAARTGLPADQIEFAPNKRFCDEVKNKVAKSRYSAVSRVAKQLGMRIGRIKKDGSRIGDVR